MDKGIRPAAIVKFLAALPTRVNTREGNTAFRKGIIAALEEEYGCTHAAGATHYNHAFIEVRKKAANDPALAALLAGLGRPEDKKGGRRPRPQAPAAPTVIPQPVTPLLQAFIDQAAPAAAQQAQEPQEPPGELISQGIRDNTGTHTITVNPPLLFDVFKVSTGDVVASGLTQAAADELVAKAAAAKKARLATRAAQ